MEWRKIIAGYQPSPKSGPVVSSWFLREDPSQEELLYCLAYALDGKLKVEDLKPGVEQLPAGTVL